MWPNHFFFRCIWHDLRSSSADILLAGYTGYRVIALLHAIYCKRIGARKIGQLTCAHYVSRPRGAFADQVELTSRRSRYRNRCRLIDSLQSAEHFSLLDNVIDHIRSLVRTYLPINGEHNATAGIRELLLLWHLVLPDIPSSDGGEQPGYAHCVLLVCFQVLADALFG